MIDRISRNFVTYSAYRQRMPSQLAVSQTYTERENVSLHNMNSRAIQAKSYHRASIENSLVAQHTGKSRLELNYPTYSLLGYVPGQIEAGAVPDRGQYIDVKG